MREKLIACLGKKPALPFLLLLTLGAPGCTQQESAQWLNEYEAEELRAGQLE